ncbi:hypothetical protein DPMN_151687 [Dreissena polymorpha]|uniref:non-specific serine/threonine protein kinase n=1 Tax=Dreissena polymorpha TaxID=45954 RepID=A0A9D4J7L0_DREPO|nr:hypothetical protein DPMN_151687 [Dreissena polymorpha]
MDMTKSLDEYVKDDGMGRSPFLNQDYTYLEVFKFWLNSIYINSGYKSAVDTISLTVILVGTHKDKMVGNDDDKEIQKDNYFRKALRSIERSPILDYIHSKTFLVSNLSREDPVFYEIQREIKLLAEKNEYWGDKYAFKWIQMEEYFDKMRGTGKRLLHIAEINIANSSFIHPLAETEIGLFLDIQHRYGNILYFNTDQLRHLVVLDPQWIVEVFKHFVVHIRNKNPLNYKHWFLYEDLAILTPEVFNEIMDHYRIKQKYREHVMHYMEHLDVMVKPLKFEEDFDATNLKQPQQPTADLAVNVNPIFLDFHTVPFRLKKPPPPISQFTSPDVCMRTPVLCFVFVQNLMPPAFFHRLVAVCIRTWPISKAGIENIMYNGLAAFDINETYVLTIWYKDHIIYARISSSKNDMISGLHFEKCKEVRLILRRSLLTFSGQPLLDEWDPGFEEYIQCPYMKKSLYNEGIFKVTSFIDCSEFACITCPIRHFIGREEVLKDWYKEALYRFNNEHDANFDDLKLLDAQSTKIIAKALKDGCEIVKHIRLMVVGMFGVGKTSLVNNLIKDLRVEKLTPVSTEGIDLHRCELMDDGDWCLDKEHKLVKYKFRFREAFKEASQLPTPTNIKGPAFTPSITEMPQDTEDEVHDYDTEEKLDPLEEIQKHVAERKDEEGIRELLPLVRETKKKFPDTIPTRVATKTDITVSVWDFAGQTLYYLTHQFFLKKRCIYLVLMDMTKSLHEYVIEDDISGTWCGLMQNCTYLDVFKFWLNAIYMYSGYKSMADTISPTVILVGTRKDEMAGNDEDKEIQKDKYFDEALGPFERSSILQHIHDKKFLVNNLSREDPVFQKIRREIKRLAEQQDYWGVKYPVKWIQMEQSLDKLRDRGKQLLHMTEIHTANSLLIHPLTEKELGLFLNIQHRHGNILFFDTKELKNLVVLAPQWIIEVFECFIRHKRNTPPLYLEHWRTYEELAILKSEVFNEIMDRSSDDIKKNRAHVIQYMEHLDVMAKTLKFEAGAEQTDLQHPQENKVDLAVNLNPNFLDFHIVPCRLTKPPPPIEQFTSPELCIKTPVLCFVFVQNFMPPSFFHRLVAVCIRIWPISRAGRKNLLYNGLAAFDITETYVLTILYKDHIIYARITTCTNDRLFGLDFEKCQEVRLILRQSLLKFAGQSLEDPRSNTAFEEHIQCPYMNKSLCNEGMFRVTSFMYCIEFACTACPIRHAIGREEALKDWYKEALDRLNIENDDNFDGSTPAEDSELLKASEIIGNGFWLLGIQLGLKEAQMNRLYKQWGEDRRTFVFKYLVKWRDINGDKATLQSLNRAIHAARVNLPNDKKHRAGFSPDYVFITESPLSINFRIKMAAMHAFLIMAVLLLQALICYFHSAHDKSNQIMLALITCLFIRACTIHLLE